MVNYHNISCLRHNSAYRDYFKWFTSDDVKGKGDRLQWVWGDLSGPIRMKYCCEGEGVIDESWINKIVFCVTVNPVKAQKAQEMHICSKFRGLQNSNGNAVGEITFVIGPSCIFVNLWGTCDSSVLQCSLQRGFPIVSLDMAGFLARILKKVKIF